MSEKKIAVYARVGNAEQLSNDKPAWIYIRRDSIPDPESFDKQRIQFREECKKHGYRILGETVAVGKGDVSMGAIQNIILSENAVKHILSPSISCLSREPLEALAVFDYITKQGVEFKAADQGEQALQPNSMLRKLGEAIGYDFGASAGYDETEETDEDEEPDESPRIQM